MRRFSSSPSVGTVKAIGQVFTLKRLTMNKKLILFGTLFLSFSSLCLTACSDDDKETSAGMPVESITATSDIDLTGRETWLFRVGYSNSGCRYYDYTLTGNTLFACVPAGEEPYRFDPARKEGETLGAPNRLVCYLQHPDYYRSTSSTREVAAELPDIADQSTEALFLRADRLKMEYTGEVCSHLSGLQVAHAHSLLEVDIEGLPNGSRVGIYSLFPEPILPLQTGVHTWKAIVPQYPSVVVQVDGKWATDSRIDFEYEYGTPGTSGKRFLLEAHWDADRQALVKDEMKTEKW